ncbi:MAG: hypothetical protein MUF59_03130 [Candidatus Krumholzibacteria bacterium]|jgi:hypothetical protein|nr:hypothetical protein [Candidatus Krumholzibacteria bacterium]
MKIHLQKDAPLFTLTLAAVIFLCSLASVAGATEMDLARYFSIEYMLSADPGEDPHLKVEPSFVVFCQSVYENQSVAVLSGDGDPVPPEPVEEMDRTVSRRSRVKNKLFLILHEFVLGGKR